MAKKKVEGSEDVLETGEVTASEDVLPTEKEKLEALLQALKDNDIRSIGDLEVKISRL